MDKIKYEITEYIAPLKESDKHDWVKAVTRISWNGGPSNIDIRNMNRIQNKIGKGISITDEEADRLLEILLDEGFGTIDVLEKAIKKKRCFKIEANDIGNCFSDNDSIDEIIVKIGD